MGSKGGGGLKGINAPPYLTNGCKRAVCKRASANCSNVLFFIEK